MDRQTCGCPLGFHKMSCFRYDEEYEQQMADAADDYINQLRKDSYSWDDAAAIVDKALGVQHLTVTPTSNHPAGTSDFWDKYDCSHIQDAYRLSDGTTFYLSGLLDDKNGFRRHVQIDQAVYFDGMWWPECIAYHIGWPDRGTPLVPLADVLRIARTVLSLAQNGKNIELGCLGAHGRTGTFVAVLELLADPACTPRQAIARVRLHHCKHAIETSEQEWYIRTAYAEIHGIAPPTRPKPAEPKPTYKYTTDRGITLYVHESYKVGDTTKHGRIVSGELVRLKARPNKAKRQRIKNKREETARRASASIRR